MQQEVAGLRALQITPKYLWFLASSYSMIIVLGNWFDLRLIKLFGVVTNAGTFIFAFTFFLSNLITEVYGYKYARLSIWGGFLFNVIVILYGQLVIRLPSPEYHSYNEMFDLLLQANNRAIVAGLISYFSAEPLNTFVMAKLKVEFQGRYVGARYILATVIAASVDSALFGFIAFYNTMNTRLLISLIFGMMFVKIVVNLLGVPFFVHFSKRLKNLEKLDIYDKGTKFNLFKLDTFYTLSANRYVNGQLTRH